MATDVISNGPSPVPSEDPTSRLQEPEVEDEVASIVEEIPKTNGKESSKSSETSSTQSNRSKKKEDKSIGNIF